MTISEIAARNEAAGMFFWSRDTRRFFNDVPSNWTVWSIAGRTFIRNHNENHRGPGMFSRCTLYGKIREVFDDGSIGESIDEAEGMNKREFEKYLKEQEAKNEGPRA